MVRLPVLVAVVGLAGLGCSQAEEPSPSLCLDCEPVARDASLLVTDREGDALLKYRADGSYEGVFADITTCDINRPSSVRMGPDGLLYLANFGNNQVLRLDVSGAFDEAHFVSASLEEPVELLFRHDELLILGNDTSNVAVVAADGTLLRDFGYPVMRGGHDMVLGPDGMLYVASSISLSLDASIQVWDPDAGELVRSFGSADEIDSATGLAFDAEGVLYVTDGVSDRVLRFDAQRGELRDVLVAGDGTLRQPVSLDFGPEGLLYVVDDRGVVCIDPKAGSLVDTPIVVGDGPLLGARSLTFLP